MTWEDLYKKNGELMSYSMRGYMWKIGKNKGMYIESYENPLVDAPRFEKFFYFGEGAYRIYNKNKIVLKYRKRVDPMIDKFNELIRRVVKFRELSLVPVGKRTINWYNDYTLVDNVYADIREYINSLNLNEKLPVIEDNDDIFQLVYAMQYTINAYIMTFIKKYLKEMSIIGYDACDFCAHGEKCTRSYKDKIKLASSINAARFCNNIDFVYKDPMMYGSIYGVCYVVDDKPNRRRLPVITGKIPGKYPNRYPALSFLRREKPHF